MADTFCIRLAFTRSFEFGRQEHLNNFNVPEDWRKLSASVTKDCVVCVDHTASVTFERQIRHLALEHKM